LESPEIQLGFDFWLLHESNVLDRCAAGVGRSFGESLVAMAHVLGYGCFQYNLATHPKGSNMQWFVVHTKPRQEQRALENLQRQGFAAWLPLLSVEKFRRGRLEQVVEPMFSRYLFIQLDKVNSNWSPIRSTMGVSKLVTFGNQPAAVPPEIVDALRSAPAQDATRFFSSGDAVRFVDGPLHGLEGLFQAPDGEARAMIFINLLSRPQVVSVELNQLAPARR
jgi:transcriptional antiterminator RfaH